MFEASVRKVGNVMIVDLKGDKLMNSGTETLDLVTNLLRSGETRILLNYEAVSYIDSWGVGEIVSCFTRASDRRAQLKLLNPRQHLLEILEHSQLDRVLECYFDEAAALASFDSPSRQ